MTLLKSKLQKAFTLIELLIVIAIIGILTAIIVGNLAQAKAKSRDAKRISDMAQVQLALELFFDRCNRYPVKDSNGLPNISDGNNGCPANITLGTFIAKIPTPPLPAEVYAYGINDNTTPTDYVLEAVLENNNAVLTDSYHGGTLYNVSCPATTNNPPFVYCLQPK